MSETRGTYQAKTRQQLAQELIRVLEMRAALLLLYAGALAGAAILARHLGKGTPLEGLAQFVLEMSQERMGIRGR
jgi:hypothetical protein